MFNVSAQLYVCSVCGAVYASRLFIGRGAGMDFGESKKVPEVLSCSAHPEAEMIDLDFKANDECETEVYLGSSK